MTSAEEAQETAVAPAANITFTPEDEGIDLHVHLPDPSIWPIIIALGISTMVVGIIVHLAVIFTGVAVFALGIGGWIWQDIVVSLRQQHEQAEQP